MVFSFSVQLWILPTLRGYCGEKTLQEYNCDSRVVPGTWSRWSWAEPYRAMDMRHKRLAQSEEKKESLQDLFSSWPQLWCCWTHRVSPQHCSLAPVWDIAQGSPPALSVRWMSMTSPRTTDKLLHRPPHQKHSPSQPLKPSLGQSGSCLGPVYRPDPVALPDIQGNKTSSPRTECPSLMTHITVCGSEVQEYAGVVWVGSFIKGFCYRTVKHEEHKDRLGGNHCLWSVHSFSRTVVPILKQKLTSHLHSWRRVSHVTSAKQAHKSK